MDTILSKHIVMAYEIRFQVIFGKKPNTKLTCQNNRLP